MSNDCSVSKCDVTKEASCYTAGCCVQAWHLIATRIAYIGSPHSKASLGSMMTSDALGWHSTPSCAVAYCLTQDYH
eukprot:319675-Amphidinium_carterae.1